MSQVFEKLQDLRNTLKTEILDFSLKLQNCNIQSELPNAIPLEFANDIYEFYPSLKNYPFLILDKKDVFLVYVDEEYREEYINISEGIIYDSYFCNIISSKYGLDVIPVNFVYEEIRETKKIYNDKNNTKCKTLKKK